MIDQDQSSSVASLLTKTQQEFMAPWLPESDMVAAWKKNIVCFDPSIAEIDWFLELLMISTMFS